MINSEEIPHVFADLPVGVGLLEGPGHVFSWANPSFAKLLLGQERDLVGLPAVSVFPEIAGQKMLGALDQVYRTGKILAARGVSAKIRQADGTNRKCLVNLSCQARRRPDGSVRGLLALAYGAAPGPERKTSPQGIDAGASLLQLITDHLPAFVSYMDRSRKYAFVNNYFAKWFELPKSRLVGKTRAEVIGSRFHSANTSRQEDRAFRGEAASFELTLTRPSGETVNLDAEYIPDFDPRTGEVRGIIGLGHDVTERKRALRAIEASESRFRSLTDAIPQLIWTCSASGLVSYANKSCLNYSGFGSREELEGGWLATLHPQERERVTQSWRDCFAGGTAFNEEYRIRRKDGEFRWFLVRSIPIKNASGAIQYWIGTAEDIEEQRRAAAELKTAKETAENANATKSAFLANMSHEIRTPLGAILGFSEFLREPGLTTDERRQYVEIIDRNGQSLTHLIDDILDLAKVEAGVIEIEQIEFSLFDLVKEVANLFAEKAKQKNIFLSLRFDEGVPAEICSDPTRLRQILINIVGNAVKFTDAGGVTITVGSRLGEGEALNLSVEVEDTGCGLDEAQKERLFKPFTQADSTTTRRFGGTGLGLALSKRFSEALGGDIQIIKYAPGAGTTFRITFRASAFARARLPSASGPLRGEKASARPLAGYKVLLVDDSVDNQTLVARILAKNGAQVEVASNGAEAVQKATQSDQDIVLMDIQMPIMDGYQAIRALRKLGYRTPVIALTAHAMVEERAKTRAAGFASHLTKPLDAQELLQTILFYPIRKARLAMPAE